MQYFLYENIKKAKKNQGFSTHPVCLSTHFSALRGTLTKTKKNLRFKITVFKPLRATNAEAFCDEVALIATKSLSLKGGRATSPMLFKRL